MSCMELVSMGIVVSFYIVSEIKIRKMLQILISFL